MSVTLEAAKPMPQRMIDEYEYSDTRELVTLVNDAAEIVHTRGESAFNELRLTGSRWRQGETYIFVLDPAGNMVVHPDPEMEGTNQLALEDVNGKPIIRGLIGAATALPDKLEGWYHYEWPVPGGLLPRWKSSYVRLVTAPSGKSYVVGSGTYNDRMERAFVVDAVKEAVGQVERDGRMAFELFHDPTGPFLAKDAYIFVYDMQGVCLVLPAFTNLEGRNLLDMEDTHGKKLVREMLEIVQTMGAGWVDYMWPKPGESVSTLKSAYVTKARMGGEWVMVGCGVYLAEALKAAPAGEKMSAPELMALVREAAQVFEQQGEKAYPEFRKKGTRWYHEDTYFFVWTMTGVEIFHAADPSREGVDSSVIRDAVGRPFGKMFLETAVSPAGEGWVHYMFPQPGSLFPAWKSVFAKRVTFPSGQPHIVGCAIYNMQMDRAFIEDVVNRAAALVADQGREAFDQLRDKKGPFYFMDTYVFVESPEGMELVNPAQPSLEGKNLIDFRDLTGKAVVQEEIAAAMRDGSAWVEHYWFKPGDNIPARKQTFVKEVVHGEETFIVGSGLYPIDEEAKANGVQKLSWSDMEMQKTGETISRQIFHGQKATIARHEIKRGAGAECHSHPNEEYACVITGAIQYTFDDREVKVSPGEVIVIPPNVPHSVVALEDCETLLFFAPAREDWQRGEDKYLRQ